MKTLILSVLLISAAVPALAVDKAALDNQIFNLTAKFEQLQQLPDRRIPADVLSKARGMICWIALGRASCSLSRAARESRWPKTPRQDGGARRRF